MHGAPRLGEHRSGVHSRATTTDEDDHDPDAALPATFPPAPLHPSPPHERGTTKLPRGHERAPARQGATGGHGQARDLRPEPTLPPVALRDAEAATLRNPRKGQSSMRRVPATLQSIPAQKQAPWLVFLAKLPATRLRSHDERKWLEARAGGRCRVFDGGLWSAEWPADRAPPLEALATALRTRFGDVRWTHAPLPAAPSPESFDGELPPQLAELVAHLR